MLFSRDERDVRVDVTINYDYNRKMERFDVSEFRGADHASSHLLSFPNHVAYDFNTTHCSRRELHGEMEQICIPENAKFEKKVPQHILPVGQGRRSSPCQHLGCSWPKGFPH